MLMLELLYKLVELFLDRSNLLPKQIGPFLQVATDVTHGIPLLLPLHSNRRCEQRFWRRLRIGKRRDFWATHREACSGPSKFRAWLHGHTCLQQKLKSTAPGLQNHDQERRF